MPVGAETNEKGHHGHHGHHNGHGQHENQSGAVVAKRGASMSMKRPAANAGTGRASVSAGMSPRVKRRAEAHKPSVGMALRRPEMPHELKQEHSRQIRASFVDNSLNLAHRGSSLARVMRNGHVVEVELGAHDEQ